MVVSVPQAVYRQGAASQYWKSPHSNLSRAEINKELAASIVGMPVTEAYVGLGAFENWIKNLRIAQRPHFADEEIDKCYVCQTQFGFWQRLHHCRRCGTANCSQCAKYFVAVPELGYTSRVRICVTCIEDIWTEKYADEAESVRQSSKILEGFYDSRGDIQKSMYGPAIFSQPSLHSLPRGYNSLPLGSIQEGEFGNQYDSGQTSLFRQRNPDENQLPLIEEDEDQLVPLGNVVQNPQTAINSDEPPLIQPEPKKKKLGFLSKERLRNARQPLFNSFGGDSSRDTDPQRLAHSRQ